ncbi:hypothetical protein NPIL_604951, partial [Nephila pilipes]
MHFDAPRHPWVNGGILFDNWAPQSYGMSFSGRGVKLKVGHRSDRWGECVWPCFDLDSISEFSLLG